MPHPKAGYYLKDGTSVPGTTGIIGRFKDSGGLLFWAFNQGKSGARTLYEERDKAGDIGSITHAMVEAHIKGLDHIDIDPNTPPEHVERARMGYSAFLEWERQSKLVIVEQEMMLVSEKHKFGGTPDAIGEFNGALALLDWKTSNAMYLDHLIQVAAYRTLWEENYPDKPLTGGFHIVRFSKEYGDFSHHWFPELDVGWRQFLLFREAYENDKELKKRAK